MFDVTETQIDVIRACLDSETLQRWLSMLARQPADNRKRLIHDVIGRMRRDGVDPDVVKAVTQLLHPAVFAAFFKTVNGSKDVHIS